ncbi:Protein stn1 [Colletotrichum chlorophyti]|uniref:CST complex subunit STN1 n=1 Tax=Colletotrichum chlorophyti TaxID=708187 RepID=A0A1Q8RMD1_9PEZI|nr:Protein stn1 [Colletotrichum chlorophyti]
MTSELSAGLYPRYCLHLSPTFNSWCILHASDIHALRSVPEFEVQDFYFYKNLPIKWVRIVGIVVAVDNFPGRRVFTVDDSSGACIECVVTLKMPSSTAHASPHANGFFGVNRPQPQPPGDCVDVGVGTVVDIKGGLKMFHDEMQIKIEKVKSLKSTEQEVALWERRTQFRNEVLLQPWVLSAKQIRRCKKEEMRDVGDESEERKKKKKEKKERKEKRQEEMRKEDEEKRPRPRAAAAVAVEDRYRIHRLRKSSDRRSGSSGGLLRHVLDESLRGKYNSLGS